MTKELYSKVDGNKIRKIFCLQSKLGSSFTTHIIITRRYSFSSEHIYLCPILFVLQASILSCAVEKFSP